MAAKDLFADDVSAVFLDAEVFGESFTSVPKSGAPNTFTAAVADDKVDTDKDSHSKRQVEILELLIADDATTGLAADPVPGEGILRNSESEPRVPYLFDAVVERGGGARLIRYQRPRQTRGGHSASSIQ